MRFAASVVFAASALFAVHAPGAEPALLPEPIVLLDGRTIAACGVRIPVQDAIAKGALEIMLARTSDGADLVARLKQTGSHTIEQFGLTTASQTSQTIFVGSPRREGEAVELRGSAASAAVTSLIQELMVSGAVLSVTYSGAETGAMTIPGPMPQSVRAAYLNCAGDLYRPGE